MGPFSGDFQRGDDSEQNIHYYTAQEIGYHTACIVARFMGITVLNERDELQS